MSGSISQIAQGLGRRYKNAIALLSNLSDNIPNTYKGMGK